MRYCNAGHPGCQYIGDANHEPSPRPPLTEEDVRRIVREELDRDKDPLRRDAPLYRPADA